MEITPTERATFRPAQAVGPYLNKSLHPKVGADCQADRLVHASCKRHLSARPAVGLYLNKSLLRSIFKLELAGCRPRGQKEPAMLQVEEARERILSQIGHLGTESIPIGKASGRYLAQQIMAPCDLPRFDNSAMDGYAVQRADLANATSITPVALKLAGIIAAGQPLLHSLSSGHCFRIFTGSPMPAGADAVVMQEDVAYGPGNKSILFKETPAPSENVRRAGEDIRHGELLLERGERVQAGTVALLASLGLEAVDVSLRPSAAVLATGDELRRPPEPLAFGQIYESNSFMLASLIEHAGAVATISPPIKDVVEETSGALETAFATSDIVITSGGASVGEFDTVKEAFVRLGGKIDFWKIAIKPGKPFLFGTWKEKLLFGLPGNPASALVTFIVFVQPAILRLQGAIDCDPSSYQATLREPLKNPGPRRQFYRVCLNADASAALAGLQGSHGLRSLARAQALAEVAPDTELPAGAGVRVIPL